MAEVQTYSRTQVALHWIIALLVIAQILFHEDIHTVWGQRMDGTIPNAPSPHLHVAVGFIILALVIWRVVLRVRRGAPPPPADEHIALQWVARITHGLFYLLLILMPISGAIAWFAGIGTPAVAHGIMEKILIALIVLHVAAALAHHFWFRTDVLRRMTRPGR